MIDVVFLPRDEFGRLLRTDLPPGVHVDADGMRVVVDPVPFESMYRSVVETRGGDPDEAWAQWMKDNPTFGRGGLG